MLQMLIEVLTQVAREVAAPMSNIDKLTVISTDGAGAVPMQVTSSIVQTMELLKNTTGVDLQSLVHRYTDRATIDGAAVAPGVGLDGDGSQPG